MADAFSSHEASLASPAEHGAAVTPDDDNDLANATRALWIGGTGDISVIFVGQSTAVLLESIPAGTLLPIRVARVLSTNTTATEIVALW